jgi:hypothetical protein
MGPEILLAILSLGGAGVTALWKISWSLGRYEARTASVLEGLGLMLKDHEDRLRTLEKPDRHR